MSDKESRHFNITSPSRTSAEQIALTNQTLIPRERGIRDDTSDDDFNVRVSGKPIFTFSDNFKWKWSRISGDNGHRPRPNGAQRSPPKDTGFPQPKDKKNGKMKVAVCCLIVVMLVGVVSIRILYRRDDIREQLGLVTVTAEDRDLRVHGTKVGVMGVNIPAGQLPFSCLEGDDHRICYQWQSTARLEVKRSLVDPDHCVKILWVQTRRGLGFRPKDCFLASTVRSYRAHWYGLGETGDARWPLDATPFDESDVITGGYEAGQTAGNRSVFGGVVDRFVMSSRNFAVIVNATVPLHASLDTRRGLCFSAALLPEGRSAAG